MTQVTVIADWTATYDNPISLSAGDQVSLTGRTDIWDGHRWLWAIDPSGPEGWVPDTLVKDGTAAHDYSAAELTCTVGETLIARRRTHGWTWCVADDGREGWVPDRCLGQLKTG